MFLLKVIVTVLYTGVYCYSDSCSSQPHGGCYQPSSPELTGLSKCSSLNLSTEGAVSWFAETSGRLDFTFALPRVNCDNITCYEFELFVDETVSEEDCVCKMHSTKLKKVHSKRAFAVHEICPQGKHCHQTCQTTAVVSFQHVFSGCYSMEVQPQASSNTREKSYSCWKYFHTNYLKKLLAGKIPNITSQYSPFSKEHTISFPVDQQVALPSSYEMHLNDKVWYMHCNNTVHLCSTMKSRDPPPHCIIKNGSISCVFSNVIPGNYCLTMFITDDRCEASTVWTTSPNETEGPLLCDWHFNFTAQDEAPAADGAKESAQDSSRFYVIFGVVSAVVVLAIIICLVALRKYIIKHYPRTPVNVLPNSMIPLEPCRIFLLYARDCQPFMELMATLREVLEDATKSEVIDCLDASRWNEIGRNPVDWVRGHIEHPNTKVVLVATQCANLRQQAHLKQAITYYKVPETYDSLFTYALKTLTENLSHDVYRKISVIRFEGFSDDGNLFSRLTPYTRFVLPLHLQKLIFNLQPSSTADQNTQLVDTKEVQKLCQVLTNLINYKNKNMNYLQDLLVIQRNYVS